MVDVSAERRANIQDKKNALDAMVGNSSSGGSSKSKSEIAEEKAIADQAMILNQIIGKSMTDVVAELKNSNQDTSDYVYTFVPTRSLRSSIQTTVSNMMVIAPSLTPTEAEKSSGSFLMLDQDGNKVFDHALVKQDCKPGSKRTFIRSPN